MNPIFGIIASAISGHLGIQPKLLLSGYYPGHLPVHMYPFTSGTGMGTKYPDPSTGAAVNDFGFGSAFAPDNLSCAFMSVGVSPYIFAYPVSSAGLGTKYANPATLPTNSGGNAQVAWNAAGTAVGAAHDISPYITIYAWTNASGFGTKYANPGTLPTGSGSGIAFNDAGTAMVMANNTASPYIEAYPFTTSGGYGTKYSNPSTLPPSASYTSAFRPGGNAVGVGCTGGEFVYTYAFSGGFGSKYAQPATTLTNMALGLEWHPLGTVLGLSGRFTNKAAAYGWSSGFGTRYTDPVNTAPGFSNGWSVSWDSTGANVAFGGYCGINGELNEIGSSVYPFTVAGGFGTKYPDVTFTLTTLAGGPAVYHTAMSK